METTMTVSSIITGMTPLVDLVLPYMTVAAVFVIGYKFGPRILALIKKS